MQLITAITSAVYSACLKYNTFLKKQCLFFKKSVVFFDIISFQEIISKNSVGDEDGDDGLIAAAAASAVAALKGRHVQTKTFK